MAQIEAGRIQLQIKAVYPMEMVNNAILAVTTVADEKQLTIKVESEKDLPLVMADAEKTAWVLNNLLTNAIKFSEAGETIIVNVTTQDKHLKFSVADNGCGIAEQYQSRIFERYFQIPGSQTQGTGLGLAISKDFIEAQNGQLSLRSQPGKGTEFFFTLPKAR